MRFQDIYESLIKLIGDLDINIYIHRRNIRPIDQEFIDQVDDDRIKIINAENLNKFFLDVFDATLSISVDTAQFHFREGIEKPAVGLYGPFPYECRTKYYKYTLSMNIESKCPNMPCFIHVKSSESICDFQQNLIDNNQYDDKWRMTAPCCCNE
jgi:ADP-heptose:LPS heptosyltransferase